MKVNKVVKSVKAIILAGGSGTRLMPFTRYTHKTLLPIYDKPVIDYALAVIRRAGIKDITIIANKHIGQIAEHIGSGITNERIHYVIEEEAKGVGSALELARPYVEKSRILLYFADNITNYDFKEDVVKFSASEDPPGAIFLVREVDNPSSFGVCKFDENENIIDIIEKPKIPPSNQAIGGIYLFDEQFWDFYDHIKINNIRFSISDITRKYVKRSQCEIRNIGHLTWVDCGTPENLIKAGIMASMGEINAEFRGQ